MLKRNLLRKVASTEINGSIVVYLDFTAAAAEDRSVHITLFVLRNRNQLV